MNPVFRLMAKRYTLHPRLSAVPPGIRKLACWMMRHPDRLRDEDRNQFAGALARSRRTQTVGQTDPDLADAVGAAPSERVAVTARQWGDEHRQPLLDVPSALSEPVSESRKCPPSSAVGLRQPAAGK
ncbi:hypothetical protein GCM10010449_64410 [Streptomyces rectiviolaceus]|uniref:Uncharacterized protein n=1 Tax=Streptomyces rectiviolaceus TaxID=332591 RepID=A0ABP6N3K8_9ACTN